MLVKCINEDVLWFLIVPSMSSSMFVTGIGIPIPEKIEVVKREHRLFMFMPMPVDVLCVSRKGHR